MTEHQRELRRARQARWRERHRGEIRERDRQRWRESEDRRLADIERQRSGDQALKRRARAAVRQALRDRTLLRPMWCERCLTWPGLDALGRPLLRAHHRNGYDPRRWLDVEWVCAGCDQRAEGRARRKRC